MFLRRPAIIVPRGHRILRPADRHPHDRFWNIARIPPGRGGSIPPLNPWAFIDGSLNAPLGAPQYPNLLNSYPTAAPPNMRVKWPVLTGTQPQWMVAGVDYAAGIPQGTALTDVSVSQPAGTSFATGVLTVNSDNVVINGYDFSKYNSGAGVQLSCTHNNLAVTNSKFGGTSYPGLATGPVDVRGTGFSFTNNIVDGGTTGGAENQTALIIRTVSGQDFGNDVLQYNWFKNYCNFVYANNAQQATNKGTLDYRFNLIDDTTALETGAHMNYLQWESGNVLSCLVAFNTTISHNGVSGGVNPGEGFQVYFNGVGTFTNPAVQNNTMTSQLFGGSNPSIASMIHGSGVSVGTTTLIGIATNSQNFFDPTGAEAMYYAGSCTPAAGWSSVGNINMTTGATVTPT